MSEPREAKMDSNTVVFNQRSRRAYADTPDPVAVERHRRMAELQAQREAKSLCREVWDE